MGRLRDWSDRNGITMSVAVHERYYREMDRIAEKHDWHNNPNNPYRDSGNDYPDDDDDYDDDDDCCRFHYHGGTHTGYCWAGCVEERFDSSDCWCSCHESCDEDD